jgi:3-phenylpropionate/trans-cinnamate dioxygenase ferredoxin reductase subunit
MRYVIVGGGLAAARAAEAMRKSGFEGEVVLVGAERELPYHRPPLSKDYLAGNVKRDDLFIQPSSFYSDNRIALELGARAVALDVPGKSITLANGRHVGFDKLLIATGTEPVRLQVPGAELQGVFYLRTLEDSNALSPALQNARSIVVVGAGLIGLEVAAVARTAGKQVTVVESAPTPLRRVFGPSWGQVVTELHREKGVDVRLSSGVAALRGSSRVEEVVLKDGSTIAADVVVIGIGVRAQVDWLKGSGVEMNDGVLVDEFCQTSVPGIYAAGDVASTWSPSLQTRVRIEQYGHAQSQGTAAGRVMAGERTPYEPLPAAGSEQFGVRLQVAGRVHESLEVAVRGDVSARSFTSFFLDSQSRVRGAISVGRPKDMMAARKLIAAGTILAASQLADEHLELGSLKSSR